MEILYVTIRNKTEMKSETSRSVLEQEYSILKALNTITNKTVRFKDFDSLNFIYHPEKNAVVLKSRPLALYQIVNKEPLHAINLSPQLLADFLLINGASGTFPDGRVITHHTLHGHGSKKKVWKQIMPQGFWKQEEV